MKTTRIKISNLFGVKEMELDGRSVELTGTNGTGKSSVLDAIRYALTNASERDYIIRRGEKEGEIVIEAGNALRIDRRKRTEQADYKSVKQDGREVGGAETFLRSVFTPMQLDPVQFIQLDKKQQSRLLLDLVQFDWDLNWIKEKFGEIPAGVNYEQNILQVLNDIQDERGDYFTRRQEINREVRNKNAFIEEIAQGIPTGYTAEKWESYDLAEKYQQIERINAENNRIERAKALVEGHANKMRGIEADFLCKVSEAERENTAERERIGAEIARLGEQIKGLRERQGSLNQALEEKKKRFDAEKQTAQAKLGADVEAAQTYACREIADASPLQAEAEQAASMKRHLREYARMRTMQEEVEALASDAQALTEKIDLARSLPGEILQTAKIPVEGLTVVEGVPLIHGMPVSNLSEGEKLNLCVDVALMKPNALQIILIDGAEKLSDSNRAKLYARCKERGLQFIATRTTNDNELEVHYL